MGRQEAAPRDSDERWWDQVLGALLHGKATADLVIKVLAGIMLAAIVAAASIGGTSFMADNLAFESTVRTAPSRPQEQPLAPSQGEEHASSGQDLPQPVLAAVAGRRLFLVPPCDGASREAHSKDLEEACRTMIEDAIAQHGGRIVERKKLDAILEETSFQENSGMVDPDSAIRIGRVLGANLLALGTVVNVDAQKKSFTGYGISTKSLVYEVSLRLRVVDVQSGEIIFSETSRGSAAETSSKYGGVQQMDGFFAALRNAIERMDLQRLKK